MRKARGVCQGCASQQDHPRPEGHPSCPAKASKPHDGAKVIEADAGAEGPFFGKSGHSYCTGESHGKPLLDLHQGNQMESIKQLRVQCRLVAAQVMWPSRC